MPNFKTVPYDSKLKSAFNKKLAAPKLMTALETQVFKPVIAVMTQNHKEWSSIILQTKEVSKKTMKKIEAHLEKIKQDSSDKGAKQHLKEIDMLTTRLKDKVAYLNKSNSEYAECFKGDGFRVDKLTAMPQKLGYFEILDIKEFTKKSSALSSQRKRVITADTRLLAERTRVGEYAKRAEFALRTAAVEIKGGLKRRSVFQGIASDIKTSISDGSKGMKERLTNINNKMDQRMQLAQKGSLPEETLMKMINDGLAPMENDRKAVSGMIKTANKKLTQIRKEFGTKKWAATPLKALMQELASTVKMYDTTVKNFSTFEEDLAAAMRKSYGK